MKIIRPFCLSWLFLACFGSVSQAQDSTSPSMDPGGWKLVTPKAISIAEIRANQTRLSRTQTKSKLAAAATSSLPPANEEDLLEMIVGLQNDAHAAFRFVQQACDFTPYYGLSKGPLRTFYDRCGNDLDLSMLLAKMLSHCSNAKDIQIVNGVMRMPVSEVASWLQVEPKFSTVIEAFRASRIPWTLNEESQIQVDRFWVSAVIDGKLCQLDPAFKRYERFTPRMTKEQILEAMGYDRDEMQAAASPIFNEDGTILTSLNVANLKAYLNSRRDRLLQDPSFADRRLGADSLLGNWRRQSSPIGDVTPAPVDLPFPLHETAQSWPWASLPDEYKTQIEIIHPDWLEKRTVFFGDTPVTTEHGYLVPTADISGEQVTLTVAEGKFPDTQPKQGPLGNAVVSPPVGVSAGQLDEPKVPDSWWSPSQNQTYPDFSFSRNWTGIQCAFGSGVAGTFSIHRNFNDYTLAAFGIKVSPPFSILSSGFNKSTGFYDITVGFYPPSPGAFSGTLQFGVKNYQVPYYQDSSYNLFSVNLQANAIAVPSGMGFHFGMVQVRTGDMPGVTIGAACSFINPTNKTLKITSATVSGAAFSSSLTQSLKNNPIILSPLTPFSIPVTYRPTAYGAHTGTLTLAMQDLANSSTQWTLSYPLAGFGVISGKAQLKVGGQIVAGDEQSVVEDVTKAALTIKIHGPSILGQEIATTHDYKTIRRGSYVIPLDFGGSGNGLKLAAVNRRIMAIKAWPETPIAAKTIKDEALLLATLEIMGLSWFQQTNQAHRFVGDWLGRRQIWFHRAGLVAQEFGTASGYYIDVANQLSSEYSMDAITKSDVLFDSNGLFMSALEHGVLEQMQTTTAASTTRMLEKALTVTGTTKPSLLKMDAQSFPAERSKLTNYSEEFLDGLQNELIGHDENWVLLPSDGKVAVVNNGWKGYGAVVKRTEATGVRSIAMLISGGYNGGYSGTSSTAKPDQVLQKAQTQQQLNKAAPPQPSSKEPINLVTGEYYYDHTDVSIGTEVPYGVSFARHYSSANASTQGVLGHGWSHNWESGVELLTDTSLAFGSRHAQDAVCAYVMAAVMDDLHADEGVASWVIRSLAANWCVDALRQNSAKVYVGNKVQFYSNHTNGAGPFYPPPGVTDILVKTGLNAYTLTSREGAVTTFKNVGSGATAKSLLSTLATLMA